MELRELPQGNGQEVYIDPDWIKGEDEQSFLFRVPDDMETTVKSLRRNVVDSLYNLGYRITSDSTTVSDDAIFFTPCCDKHINNTEKEYKAKKDTKIRDCLSDEKVKEPLTILFPEDSFPLTLLPLPFVLKNKQENGGIEKFIIRTPEQLDIFKRFYDEIKAYDRQIRVEAARKQFSFLGDTSNLEFDEKGNSIAGTGHMRGLSILNPNFKKKLHEDFVIQKFIKTPTKYNTSLRVVTSSSGDILCSSLKYSEGVANTGEKWVAQGLFDMYLSDPKSPYYLGGESIVSNTVAGGNSILLGRNNYSPLDQDILLAHEIDPNNAVVPQDVASAAIKIATTCEREIGAISGMDFIYDEEEKAWKYLEQQEYPMLNTYAEAYGLPYNSSADEVKFLETHRIADIDSRLRSLALTMQKKQGFASEESQLGKSK